MECSEARNLLNPYVDGELGVSEALALDQHLENCADCRALRTAYATLRQKVREHADYFDARTGLKERIEAALPAPAAPRSRAPASKWDWRWINAGAVLVSIIAIAWSVGLYVTLPSAHERLGDEIVSAHVRSLLSSRGTDVASSDQHTVKPWFSGKIDFAPRVQDLTGEGFPLVGGRVDFVNGRRVATLVYRRRQHTIDVFEFPNASAADTPAAKTSKNGYNVISWTYRGMTYWAVSDVDAADLAKLAALLAPT